MTALPYSGPATPLGPSDIAHAASALGCDVAAVKAVLTVETGGLGGFLPDKRPRILFEAAVFHRLTGGEFDDRYPNLSAATWNRKLYRGGAAEYGRLIVAASLDQQAALKSASWGLFQILGLNYRTAGYASVDGFVAAMIESEANHLAAFVAFAKANGLDKHLCCCDWPAFARAYNGPLFASNKYDSRLQTAFAAAAGNPVA